MRTKTLLTTAALSVAGLLSASAQVYSVNAVGYVNLNLSAGYHIIANPLNAKNASGQTQNLLSTLITNVPDGTQVTRWDSANQRYLTPSEYFVGFGWDPDVTLNPGEAFFLKVPAASTVNLTFVGEVPQGSLTNSLKAGYNLVASIVPQGGKITTDLLLPGADTDQAVVWNSTTQKYESPAEYFTAIPGWDPVEPVVGVGQGFFVRKSAAVDWKRTFSVNN